MLALPGEVLTLQIKTRMLAIGSFASSAYFPPPPAAHSALVPLRANFAPLDSHSHAIVIAFSVTIAIIDSASSCSERGSALVIPVSDWFFSGFLFDGPFITPHVDLQNGCGPVCIAFNKGPYHLSPCPHALLRASTSLPIHKNTPISSLAPIPMPKTRRSAELKTLPPPIYSHHDARSNVSLTSLQSS